VAGDDNYTTDEDTPFTATLGVDDLLQNDSDLDGDSLMVNMTPVSGVSNGTLALNANGTFTYTPDTNFSGSDSFTYEVSDGNGGTAQASVTIMVEAVNDAPDGDLNLDGVVNTGDVVIANRIALGLIPASPEQMTHGDVAPLIAGSPFPDGVINVADVLLIQRKVLGLISFP
jgi:VCBS repeat-containing protein